MAWTTEENTLTVTGETVDATDLAKASAIITLYAGCTEDQPAASITTRDRYWLAMATAYQAAWMPKKPGLVTERESHHRMGADGMSADRRSDSDIVLAPLAARALRNLSWMGARTAYTGPAILPRGASFTNEASDDMHYWRPL